MKLFLKMEMCTGRMNWKLTFWNTEKDENLGVVLIEVSCEA